MRLEITRRADLAVKAMLVLARAESRVKGGDLAAELGTTIGFVPQVVRPLVKSGWVGSEPGPSGGYTTRVRLDQVSVLDVLEAVDGPTDAGQCVVPDRRCGGGPVCALHVSWTKARGDLVASLARTPLSAAAVGETG